MFMGRIKTTQIKRSSERLVQSYRDEFDSDFNKNKLILGKFTSIPSKKLRNKIAGYVTRLVKTREEL